MNGESGVQLILRERVRQIFDEGWTKKHDDEHVKGELIGAARAYLIATHHPNLFDIYNLPASWPTNWDKKLWKPSKDLKRNLVKAGTLIAAELDRLLRKEENDRVKVN